MVAILGSAIFFVIAPGIVAGYVPWRICRWHLGAPLLGTSAFRLVGVLLIVAGLPVFLDSFARFALQGLGAPAPILPTRHLVVSGLYRYVRNPMYVAMVAIRKLKRTRLAEKRDIIIEIPLKVDQNGGRRTVQVPSLYLHFYSFLTRHATPALTCARNNDARSDRTSSTIDGNRLRAALRSQCCFIFTHCSTFVQ